ncbi:MAG: extracellular solute-binding protein [Chloroflexi bacterium]|nr:extracellular solute-binding protein [Chloroflexota bacterium]MBV9597148.1 extracellular solute-binding protein [Chloroflexota bacterium]
MSALSSRRAFLGTLALGGIGLLAAACAAPATPAASTSAPPTTAPAVKPTSASAAPATSAPAPTAASAAAPTTATTTSASLATPPDYPFPTGPVTVTWQHGSDVTTNKLYTDIFLPAYMQMHPNVTIQHEAVPGIDQKLLVEIATNTAPTMFDASAVTLQALMPKGALSPVPPAAWGVSTIDEMLSKYYLPKVMEPLMSGGNLYAIPNQMNSQSLMLNTRLFKASGLDPAKDAPKTWDDVVKLQPTLTKRDASGQITQKGFEFIWARPDTISTWGMQLLIQQAGGKILEDDGATPAFNTDAGLTALQMIKKLSVDPSVTRNTAAVVQQDWATELNVMGQGGPNWGLLCETINPNVKGNYIFSDMPQLDTSKPANLFIVFSICVNNAAPDDQKAVAHDLIRFMAQQPEQWLQSTGQLTPMQSLANSSSAREVMPFLDIALHDLQIAIPPLNSPYVPQLNDAFKAAAERVVLENQEPKASLDQAESDYKQSIKS